MFKYFYQNESEIPADQKAYYENRDGGWWLKVEGAVPKDKLDEFRNKNIELTQQKRDAEEKLKPYLDAGVDISKYKELVGKERDLAEGQLYKKGELDRIIEERTKAIKEENDRQSKAQKDVLDAKERDLQAALARESKLVIDQGLIAAARKLQLKGGLEDVVLALAQGQWKMVDGKPQCFGPDGKPAYSNKTALDKSMDEWVEDLAKAKPMLFTESQGSGSEPGGAGAAGAGANGSGTAGNPGYNPYDEKTWNVTKQMELSNKNPAEAKRLCEKAGRKWVPPTKPAGAAVAGGQR